MGTPKEILEHKDRYIDGAWRGYDPWELGMWVNLFLKRSFHRIEYAKKIKDLTDARNYCAMLREIIEETIVAARETEHQRKAEDGTLEPGS